MEQSCPSIKTAQPNNCKKNHLAKERITLSQIVQREALGGEQVECGCELCRFKLKVEDCGRLDGVDHKSHDKLALLLKAL